MPTVPACARSACLVSISLQLLALAFFVGCNGIEPLPPPSLPALGTSNPAAGFPATGIPGSALPNPMSVPVRDPEFFWNQLVDTIDDYFDIRSEQRVHLVGNVATEGRIESKPQPGATLFEPWRWDSTPGYEKWHATLQSLRRKCIVSVQPQGAEFHRDGHRGKGH